VPEQNDAIDPELPPEPAAPPEPSARQRRVAAAAVLVTMLVASIVTFARLQPPASAPPALEDAVAAAHKELAWIARDPRPLGSPHNLAVREYLIEQLRGAGWQVSVQTGRTPRPVWGRDRKPDWRSGPPVEVANIVATRPGTASPGQGGRTLLLVAHYDSANRSPAGPALGAGDDGAGTVAVLAAARRLATLPPTRNTVTVLLTDGEELGLLGAHVYERSLTEADRAALGAVLNFEGRGAWGPVILFETSGDEVALLRQFASAAGASLRPVTSSASSAVYAVMPNATDFTVFRNAAVPGLNFAFIGGWKHYHEPTDSIENLSRDTLRHHVLLADALATALADADLSTLGPPRPAVFFDVLSAVVVRWPAWLAVPLSGAAAALWLAAAVRARRAGLSRWRGVAVAATLPLAALIFTVGGAALLLWRARGADLMTTESLAGGGFILLAMAAAALADALVRRWTRPAELVAGVALALSALNAAASAGMPGTSYLFLIPALALTGVLAALVARRGAGPTSTAVVVAQCSAVAVAMVVALPPVYLGLLGTVPSVVPKAITGWGFDVPVGVIGAAIASLLLTPLLPALRLLSGRSRWLGPAALALAAVACLLLSTGPWLG
jgi:hypothetical protein